MAAQAANAGQQEQQQEVQGEKKTMAKRLRWLGGGGTGKKANDHMQARGSTATAQSSDTEYDKNSTDKTRRRWTMGILNDSETDEVPGSVLLLSKASEYNEPLGLRNAPARTSASSLPMSPYPDGRPRRSRSWSSRRGAPRPPEKKRTSDGKFVLEPQPDDSMNDPLNWATWRRDLALLSLGFYCMVGGGMTPVLAAGFNDVAAEFNTNEASVALTTGMYMLGLGMGSVFLSPTAILFGKRPVYLVAAICFIVTSVWCALSPNLPSLIVARVFMGLAVSSVECLPSATVAEIYFLHEKAYRLGIYTLLLLGGKNLVPLVSAAIIQSLGWRWVFWVICMVVGFCWFLLFFFVPETFWDRTPRPHHRHVRKRRSFFRTHSAMTVGSLIRGRRHNEGAVNDDEKADAEIEPVRSAIEPARQEKHAHFASSEDAASDEKATPDDKDEKFADAKENIDDKTPGPALKISTPAPAIVPPQTTDNVDYFGLSPIATDDRHSNAQSIPPGSPHLTPYPHDLERGPSHQQIPDGVINSPNAYTDNLLNQPAKTFTQQLRPWSGRLRKDKWIRVAIRPFILFAYPSILWSALVYALSIGWLIVLSESVAHIYEDRDSYNFSALQTGLVYISPFVGGIIGTAVAGKVSDYIVRYMAKQNGGVYEPEFRLIMAIPITVTTVIGLMGYGWSAAEHDAWIVPTVFFGIISFGCSLGSTTSITFAVDSYRQYSGESLVTLNFSKNILHGMVFSLFFNNWLSSDGSKITFIAIGVIQLVCLATTVPMYMYGKRARMWTVRKNLMEKF